MEESIAHKRSALNLHRDPAVVEDHSVYLEEYARGQIGAKEMHLLEMRKLLRDFAV